MIRNVIPCTHDTENSPDSADMLAKKIYDLCIYMDVKNRCLYNMAQKNVGRVCLLMLAAFLLFKISGCPS